MNDIPLMLNNQPKITEILMSYYYETLCALL